MLQLAVAPIVHLIVVSVRGLTARTYLEGLQGQPELHAALKVANGLGAEAVPLLDKARATVLGIYEQYMRPQIGTYLSECIDHIKIYLDKIMPAE